MNKLYLSLVFLILSISLILLESEKNPYRGLIIYKYKVDKIYNVVFVPDFVTNKVTIEVDSLLYNKVSVGDDVLLNIPKYKIEVESKFFYYAAWFFVFVFSCFSFLYLKEPPKKSL